MRKSTYAITQDMRLICRLDASWERKNIKISRAGGQTNRNYVVAFKKPFDGLGARKFFVRFPWERGDVIDRTIEGKNILALSRNKKLQHILPKYYSYILKKKNVLAPKTGERFDVPDGTMVTEFLDGREFTMDDFQQTKYQKALAAALSIFHTSGVRFVNPYNVFRDEIRKYRFAAMKHQLRKFLDENTIHQLQEIEKEAEQKLPAFKQGISTHNDFIFQNVLVAKNGRVYLLDFEYAGLNKKGGIFYDLGYIFRDSFFNPPRMNTKTFERFLSIADKAYKKKIDRSQIYWSVIAALLVGIWWGVLRYFSVPQKEREYFRRYVQRGVQGVLELYPEIKREG